MKTIVEDEYVDLCHEFDTDDPCGCHVDYQWMIACQNRCDKCPTCFACNGRPTSWLDPTSWPRIRGPFPDEVSTEKPEGNK